MTPKDKAEDLFVTFYQRYSDSIYSNEGAKIEAKYCALVVVDEVMSALMGYDFYYWQEVKQEIEKL
jgi:hypothetical protein